MSNFFGGLNLAVLIMAVVCGIGFYMTSDKLYIVLLLMTAGFSRLEWLIKNRHD